MATNSELRVYHIVAHASLWTTDATHSAAATAACSLGISICDSLSSTEASMVTLRGEVASAWACRAPSGGGLCSTTQEGGVIMLSCGVWGGTITGVQFASFGTPTGECSSDTAAGGSGLRINSTCNSVNSTKVCVVCCVCVRGLRRSMYAANCHSLSHLCACVSVLRGAGGARAMRRQE